MLASGGRSRKCKGPEQSGEARSPWSQDPVLLAASCGVQGPLPRIWHHTACQDGPRVGQERGLAAHSREGPGQVRSLPPRHPASASPAHKSRLPNEVPRSLKELQGPLL